MISTMLIKTTIETVIMIMKMIITRIIITVVVILMIMVVMVREECEKTWVAGCRLVYIVKK